MVVKMKKTTNGVPTGRRSAAPAGVKVPKRNDMPEVPAKPVRVLKGGAPEPLSKPVAKVRVPKQMKECQCGCGGATFANFCIGHDAKHKSNLIKIAMTGKAAEARKAEKELADRKWTKFLDKARELASRPKPERKPATRVAKGRELLRPSGISEGDFKVACDMLREHGIDPPRRMSTSTVESILDGTYGAKHGWDEEEVEDEVDDDTEVDEDEDEDEDDEDEDEEDDEEE